MNKSKFRDFETSVGALIGSSGAGNAAALKTGHGGRKGDACLCLSKICHPLQRRTPTELHETRETGLTKPDASFSDRDEMIVLLLL